MSLNLISNMSMSSQVSQVSAHKTTDNARPAKATANTSMRLGQQNVQKTRNREEMTESTGERALEAKSSRNVNTSSHQGRSINLFA